MGAGRRLRALVGVGVAVAVTLAWLFPRPMENPGPLIDAHRELAGRCFACHTPWHGASSQRCIRCHALADIGVRSTRGVALGRPNIKASFHQQLLERDCLACHSDHRGRMLHPLSSIPFSHGLLQASARPACDSCHQAPIDRLHRVLRDNCNACHGVQRWEPARFEHDRLYVLDDLHRTRCVKCHTERNHRHYTCYGCHEHQAAEMLPRHLREHISDLRGCARCHHGGDTPVHDDGDPP